MAKTAKNTDMVKMAQKAIMPEKGLNNQYDQNCKIGPDLVNDRIGENVRKANLITKAKRTKRPKCQKRTQ